MTAPASSGGLSTQFWVYTEIFPISTWLVIAGTILVLGAAFALVARTGACRFHAAADPEHFSLLNGLAVCTLLLFQLSYDMTLASASAKILVLSASHLTFLIFTYYTCDLTARMTSGPAPFEIRSFRDVIDREYRVITQPGTSNHEFLRTAKEGTAMHAVYYGTMDGNPEAFVDTQAIGWDLVKTQPKVLLFESSVGLMGRTDVVSLDMVDSIHGQIGWALRKDSEFKELFDFHLAKLKETGVIPHIVHVS